MGPGSTSTLPLALAGPFDVVLFGVRRGVLVGIPTFVSALYIMYMYIHVYISVYIYTHLQVNVQVLNYLLLLVFTCLKPNKDAKMAAQALRRP